MWQGDLDKKSMFILATLGVEGATRIPTDSPDMAGDCQDVHAESHGDYTGLTTAIGEKHRLATHIDEYISHACKDDRPIWNLFCHVLKIVCAHGKT